MDASAVLTVVQTLVQVLDSSISKEIESLWGYKSELEKLRGTMSTIEAVLLNAEKAEKLRLRPANNIPQITLERLKDVVYQAEDLFDEIATVAQRKKLMEGNRLSKEVRLFFSRFNQLHYAFTKSLEIRRIREILDGIARDHRDFGSILVQPQLQPPVDMGVIHSRETHSFVCEEDVIVGRNEDERILIDMLLDTSVVEDVSFISIVGIGGLGKTALAQLVFNNEKVASEFTLHMWVCVSDVFDAATIIGKILAAATSNRTSDNTGLSLDQLQRNLREILDRNKYLLVLDDVWNEDPTKWHELRKVLINGMKGSRVIVTTRSKRVAYIVGSHQTLELEGLSDQDSWDLFQRMTLEPGQLQLESHLVQIGKEIVRKCANVPLAVRVIGSLLRGNKDARWWQYLENMDLPDIKRDENNDIFGVLKISYYYLPLHLKSCFSYCALFPKDYDINKEELIYLWMAQGFITPLDGQSFEVLGEEYFINLLQRCFFQDLERNENGEIISCKMHDLIHDLAKEVAGIEIMSSDDDINSWCNKTRHVFIDDVEAVHFNRCLAKMKRLRTFLLSSDFVDSYAWYTLLKMKYLMALDLRRGPELPKKVPSMIGNLLHLRYLNLSGYGILRKLPNSITKLHNLQTLLLTGCGSLEELPKELSTLVKLRNLDISHCCSLIHMPQRMNRMTSLHKLPMFVVGSMNPVGNSGLGDLKSLINLRGSLRVEISVEKGWYDAAEVREGGFLMNKPHLRKIEICWCPGRSSFTTAEEDDICKGRKEEAQLQALQPHPNIQKLHLEYYHGVRFASWGDSSMNLRNSLPNLVEIVLRYCARLEHLPMLSQLCHLKVLIIESSRKLQFVEYSESGTDGASPKALGESTHVGAHELEFFQSLEKLELVGLPELKGWWKITDFVHTENNIQQQQQHGHQRSSALGFPRLLELQIRDCPKLTTFPLCPKLEKLSLTGSSRALSPIMIQGWSSDRLPTSSSEWVNSCDDSPSTSTSKYKEGQGRLGIVEIGNARYLNSLPLESFQHLSKLSIMKDNNIQRITTIKVFHSSYMSSLCSLTLHGCKKLKSISGRVWENFTALETLILWDLQELEFEDDEHVTEGTANGMPWRCLARTLSSLTLENLPKLVKLPEGMQHLTSLQSLSVAKCEDFEEIPTWIGCLSSLQDLYIGCCQNLQTLPEEMCHLTCLNQLRLHKCSNELKERCQKSSGTDWYKIQHIPHIGIS